MSNGNGKLSPASNGQPNGRRSVIDEGTTFKGVIAGGSTVVVLGVLEGEVTGPCVEVERGGILIGKAKVTELRSRGELAGEFEADDVELYGRVRDQTVIRAKALLVSAPDALHGDPEAFFGECLIEVGDPPSKEQAVSQAVSNSRAADIRIDSAASGPVPIAIIPPAPPAPGPSGSVGPAGEASAEPPADKLDVSETQAYGAGGKRKGPRLDRPVEGA